MVKFSRFLSAGLFFAGAEGARISRNRANTNPANVKIVAGVPIINYNAAYNNDGQIGAQSENREGEWIVMLHEGTSAAQIQELCRGSQSRCKSAGNPDAGGVAFMHLKGTEQHLEALVQKGGGAVKFIEPDQTIQAIPVIPEASPEASISSVKSWGLERTNVPGEANHGAGVHIFILDTGVRTTHVDFGGRASSAVDFSSGSKVECNGDLNCAVDRQGHGTHCAGTAGGTTFGVAPKAKIYGGKVLGDNGSGSLLSITGAMDWVAASSLRPAVASMSLGGPCPLGWCGAMAAVASAVDAMVEAGVTVTVAGGNDNSDACGFQPAFVPSAITVGSTDSTDTRSYFSNYGKCTDFWAPGSAITSASSDDDTGAKTFSGTSMACPHVAGASALILENNPSFKAEQVIDALIKNSGKNYIKDLKSDDTNKLLYVGADAPPAPGSVPAPQEPDCPFYCVFCLVDSCKGCC